MYHPSRNSAFNWQHRPNMAQEISRVEKIEDDGDMMLLDIDHQISGQIEATGSQKRSGSNTDEETIQKKARSLATHEKEEKIELQLFFDREPCVGVTVQIPVVSYCMLGECNQCSLRHWQSISVHSEDLAS
ncbi:hypothetical protein PROFUN_08920 [Planoprotostelium fungivorum]|uniref:Uncharacterized protein n=1 Tax=Planoprotostelium fungivorum TaxID=1890364 RepID=A0A2P6NIM4_9EUKA|nr:hypothetical protein PROFUN_08920 [Planoprotostelium fungivorum]